MGNRVLIIAKTETFTIKGMEMKLKGIGCDPTFSTAKVTELSTYMEWADLYILYTDEDFKDMVSGLVFLKDHCDNTDKRVIVIGAKLEYEIVLRTLPEMYVYKFFERPLVIEKLLDSVETYLSQSNNKEKRKSILIVDDDVQYMSMISDWLKETYRVSMANSGINAITWLATNSADLILLDYEMPITPGPQVLEMLRSNAATADIPVMFLTGNNDRDSIVKVVSLRPVDYLLKTIDKKGLQEKLDSYFASKAGK